MNANNYENVVPWLSVDDYLLNVREILSRSMDAADFDTKIRLAFGSGVDTTEERAMIRDFASSGSGLLPLKISQPNGQNAAAYSLLFEPIAQSSTPPPIIGTSGNDTLHGTRGNDVINGLAGNDRLSGRRGKDTLDGGDGNDILYGGGGIDTLVGGLGDDIYQDPRADTITELPGQGEDTVRSSVRYSLAALANVENLTLTGSTAIRGTGNTGNNKLTGNSANNSLFGSDSNDVLKGGAGIDILVGGVGNDSLTGGADIDTLVGGLVSVKK